MDIVELMKAESAYWLALAGESFDEGEFMNPNDFSLADVESLLQLRMNELAEREAPFEELLPAYTAFIQLKQAQALEQIAKNLDTFRINGLPIENVGGSWK